MQDRIRNMMKEKAIPALLSIALGIVIIIARRSALDLLVKIIGGLVITCGIGFVASYLIRPDTGKEELKMSLAMAGIAVLVGIILISFAPDIVNMFPTIMGILLILNGMSHLAAAGMDRENRIVIGAMGILVILFGILIIARPGIVADAVMVFIGVFFILNGLMDLFVVRKVNGSGF